MRTLGGTEGGAIMWNTVWFCMFTFLLMAVLVLAARFRLEEQRAKLDELYLADEEA